MYDINSHIDSLKQKHQRIIEDSEKYTSEYIKLLTQASVILPKIEKAFDNAGFKVEDLHCRRTGINDDGNSLKLNYKILPKLPKYRYILFDGYNKYGAGRNQNKLRQRAIDLQDKIFQETNLKCSVNQFCFEINQRQEKGGDILVDFWLEMEVD